MSEGTCGLQAQVLRQPWEQRAGFVQGAEGGCGHKSERVAVGRDLRGCLPPVPTSEIVSTTGTGRAAWSFLGWASGGPSSPGTHPLSTRKESRHTLIFFFK